MDHHVKEKVLSWGGMAHAGWGVSASPCLLVIALPDSHTGTWLGVVVTLVG